MERDKKILSGLFIGTLILFCVSTWFLLGIIHNNLGEINELNKKLNMSEKQLSDLRDNSVNLTTTMDKIEKVVRETKIDQQASSADYVCTDYADDLVKAFRERGIYACVNDLWFYGADTWAHTNVVLKTKKYGLVYVEPQNDKIIKQLNIDDNYSRYMDWEEAWYISDMKNCFERLP